MDGSLTVTTEKLNFGTKAQTLSSLQSVLTSARIAPMCIFSVREWQTNKSHCLDRVLGELGRGPFIVRSSCLQEDGSAFSNAGAFLSVLNVERQDLVNAIEKVIGSYFEPRSSDEVLIQPMLTSVVRSGVGFTHDPNTCAPYRIINWSEGSNTSEVTGGLGGRVWQQAAKLPPDVVVPSTCLEPILALIEELFVLFGNKPLDCEFAVTKTSTEQLWLLQVRPLILRQIAQSESEQFDCLQTIRAKLVRGIGDHPFLIGQRTVFGVMPDWNPAEIVGVRPKPLALSLYRELITDSIWAYQRHNYGYRNLRSFPLMPHFFGLPYIDVRLSFNSFIPVDLDDRLAGRLVDYYINRLVAEPALHDKVEFEIVFSCYTLDLPNRLKSLLQRGFTDADQQAISDSLRHLTNRIVDQKDGLWLSDAAKIGTLHERREALLGSRSDALERIYWLLEDTKRYGTLPFAGLARAGFVAVQLLRSLVAVGVLSQSDYDSFLGGVSTVSVQLAHDRAALGRAAFLARYGHLRPGTYDILSQRYDEAPDFYFDWDSRPSAYREAKPFVLSLAQMREIGNLLEVHGLKADPVGLFDFIQAGIELRESAKFNFTRNLSDVLSLISDVGARYGFTREELAFCDIAIFKEMHVGAVDAKDLLRRSIDQGKSRYAETLKLSLPPLIASPDDIWAFEWPEAAPNFITQKQVSGPVVGCDARNLLAGAIVCIPSADPGFDWLFAYPIAGLVTAWGGVNSHMAIRAGEIGLPAVIGAGEVFFRRWSAAQRLYLDCAGRRVEVLG